MFKLVISDYIHTTIFHVPQYGNTEGSNFFLCLFKITMGSEVDDCQRSVGPMLVHERS